MKGKKQVIQIKNRILSGKERCTEIPVTALVFEKLAIHKTGNVFYNKCFDYTITHIPTGYAVCHGLDSQKIARACVEELLTSGISWNFNRPEDLPKMTTRKVTPIVKKFRNLRRFEKGVIE